nr:reverse transcriptase domain-containing protein [Tanacetum cinerariifolium]
MFSLVWIMSPRVMTRSAGRLVAESRRGGTNGLGANGSVEGGNRNVEGVNRRTPNFSMIISQQLQNLLPTMLALVEFCPSHEMQKLESELWNYSMVGAGHVTYTDRFHELASVPPATPTMHPEGLVAHASTVTAWVIWQRIVEEYEGM